MTHVVIAYFLLAFVPLLNSFLIVNNIGRNVTKTLRVNNGWIFGPWGAPDFCAYGAYAVGYNMKIEGEQHGGDDTALNGIQLQCENLDGLFGGDVKSTSGRWGPWVGLAFCHENGVGTHHFMKAFALQVEPDQHHGDDTAANYVKFSCQDFASQVPAYELAHSPGHGVWGSYGAWSDNCGKDSAICGIQTKIEGDQGHGDDTTLNDVIMYCCSD